MGDASNAPAKQTGWSAAADTTASWSATATY